MSIIGLDDFSGLVENIYDAALAPGQWPSALGKICKLLNCQTAALWSYDLYDRTPPWQLEIGYDPYWMKRYTEKYLALNPYMDDVARMSPGEANYSSSRPEYQELFKTEFYQDWLKPQRFIDSSVLMVEKSMNTITTFVNVRNEDQGLFDSATIDLVNMLYPHLRRAVLIGRVVREHQDHAAEYSAALDALATGMFLVTGAAELVHANVAGGTILAAGTPLKKVDGALILDDKQANRILREALATANAGDVTLGQKGTSIPLRGATGEFILHMMPLNAARRKSVGSVGRATHVLFLSRNDPKDATVIAAFAKRFRLTAQETRVLETVVDAGSVPMAADILGISPSTARTHVTSIFDKTGVRRQADLLRLLMEMKSPFVR
ncbi:MAG: helix-turn-helix transcriptional regulator [Hyphomicrobiales bacterium]|nr:helix-turn-helix transcriptional regulator [Hyphomicrobiales bacterium]MDE2115298.1 helix-turn-helix transcriptional regulator [Hyphomicrobiales bacterium]